MKLYRPKQSFAVSYEGISQSLNRDTLVEEGHPLLDMYPELFEVMEPHFKAPVKEKKRSVESATAGPGEKRNR